MVQARPFGNLKYDEQSHGWALEVGIFLGSWATTRETGCTDEDTIQNFWENDAMCRGAITSRLQSHRISVMIPKYYEKPEESANVSQRIVENIRNVWSPEHCAFMLIGEAGIIFEALNTVTASSDIREFERRIRSAIAQLHKHCAALFPSGLQQDAIYEQLRRVKGDVHKIRQLLLDSQKPMLILLVLADPVEGGRLRLLNEVQRLSDSLDQSTHRGSFELQTLSDARIDNFGPTIARTKPTIIHFSGHGSTDGILLSDQSGQSKMIKPQQLSRILSLASEKNLQGVVMNACFTADSFRQYGPLGQQAIVMEGSLSDSVAISFSQQFYAYLGEGYSFKEAFEWAEASTDLTGNELIKAAFIE